MSQDVQSLLTAHSHQPEVNLLIQIGLVQGHLSHGSLIWVFQFFQPLPRSSVSQSSMGSFGIVFVNPLLDQGGIFFIADDNPILGFSPTTMRWSSNIPTTYVFFGNTAGKPMTVGK